jgi:IrrE N-terminal-like domain
MKYVQDCLHGFPMRPHYEPSELDVMFERLVVAFLKDKYRDVRFPMSTEDLKTLIERDVSDLEQYADLCRYGPGVEGATVFQGKSKPKVFVTAELSEDDRRENRLRTTLTHEYGHVKLHTYLYALDQPRLPLMDAQTRALGIYCKRDTMIQAGRTDWMEWQAGYACGAALMPATYIRRTVAALHEQLGIFGSTLPDSAHGRTVIDTVVEGYQVSRDAARVRLCVLGLMGQATSLALPLG